MWCQHWCQWHNMTKKVMVQHQLMPISVPNVSHDQKTCFTCLDHHYYRNAVVPLMIPLASHGADACANHIIWSKKSCCISFSLSGPNKCVGAIDDSICHVMAMVVSHDQKCHVASCFSHLDLAKNSALDKCYSCHMMLVLVPTASHDQKSHVTACFSCLNLID